MNKISSLARMGIAHRCFGNPIPQAAYDLIEATEKCVEEFNPASKIEKAAPDLLEALQAVVRVVDRDTEEFDMARAAIAKALGK